MPESKAAVKKWINNDIPLLADTLEAHILATSHVETAEGLNVTGRAAVYALLDDILSILFPGAYSAESIENCELNCYLAEKMRYIYRWLTKRIMEVLHCYCSHTSCETCTCKAKAETISCSFMNQIPEIRTKLVADIQSGYDGDPSAKSQQEIILSYPYVEAVATHRVAHALYCLDVPVLPRIMAERAHSRTGIDIHPGARIGKGFFIDHGTGVVIGETCRIGEKVTMYHGVTLGAFSPYDREGNRFKGKKRHPDIENNVIIYSGAVILGGDTVIGEGSVIGGNAWITESVAPRSVVYNKFETIVQQTHNQN